MAYVSKSRRDFIIKTARDFLITNKVRILPVNVDELFRKNGWIIDSVTSAENVAKMVTPFGFYSDKERDAVTCLYKGMYVTFYKDWVISEGRILWSKAHELGHIVLKHLEFFDDIYNTYDLDDKYKLLDREADIFAAELLAPLPVIAMCGCNTQEKVRQLCGLSREAAGNTVSDLKIWSSKDDKEERAIVRHFFNFILKKDFYSRWYYKVCLGCESYIINSADRFCKICGKQIVGGRTLMNGIHYDDGANTDMNGRILICPVCSNHEFSEGALFCKICGTPLYNKCLNETGYSCKQHLLDTSSRFCSRCGSRSLFNIKGILEPWYNVKKQIQNDNTHIVPAFLPGFEPYEHWNYLIYRVKLEDNPELYIALMNTTAYFSDTAFVICCNDVYSAAALNKEYTRSYLSYLLNKYCCLSGCQITVVLNKQIYNKKSQSTLL